MEQGCTLTSAVSPHLLRGEPLDLQLSKHDFIIVLLRSLGPAIMSSAAVDEIFEQIDEDKDGLINVDGLSNFLQSNEHRSFSHFMTKRLVHASNVGSSMFVCGSSLSMLNNVWKRSHEIEGSMLFVSYMIMWLFLIGSTVFAIEFLRTTINRLKVKGEGVELLARHLLWKNFSSIEQIVNLFWLFGSLAYVLATHSKHLNLTNAATSGLWVVGGINFLFAGLLAFPSIYKSTSEKINQQKDMQKKMNGFIESRSRQMNRRYTINCPEQTFDLCHTSVRMRRSISESYTQPIHQKPFHQRHNTCPVMIDIDVVLDADTHPREKITHGCNAESLKTIDTESFTSSEDDSKFSRRMSDCSLENSACSPSYDDLYASLSSDAPINLDVFVQVLFHEQFANKVDNHNLKLCQEIAISSSSCIALLYIVAGALFTIGAIDAGFTHDAVQNIFLSGSCIYFCAGSFGLFKQWKAARSNWDSLQSVVSALQQYTFQEITTQPTLV